MVAIIERLQKEVNFDCRISETNDQMAMELGDNVRTGCKNKGFGVYTRESRIFLLAVSCTQENKENCESAKEIRAGRKEKRK